jgi:DNA-binding SARP family transcriptional activator
MHRVYPSNRDVDMTCRGAKTAGMGVRVLGPVEVDEGPVSPRERIVLSVLVIRSGAAVSPDELADALWPEEPASTWPKQVQATITRLRRALGARAIRTEAGGYRLDIDPESIDAVRFERLVATARGHGADDDPARAIDGFDRALALWRGRPYPELAGWPTGAAEADRLAEIRSDIDEERAAQRLRLGDHRAVIPEAERLVREAPLRESRWVLLATALYRSGRQADALAAIRASRERLGDDLGIDVGEELESLELAILRHDPTLAPPDAPGAVSPTCPYRGLHPFGIEDADEFFGRDPDIVAALSRLARSPFLAVSGASGSGKSSLVRAGIVPALQRRGDRVAILTPQHDLDVHLRDAVGPAGRSDVVVIDQFEEIFHSEPTHVDEAARAIVDAVTGGTSVIVVVRSDFLDDCAAHPELARLVAEGVHLVGPMAPDALRQAIEQPALRAGLRLEPGLVEVVLRDAAGEAGALPHMSHALVQTWLRREGSTLTVAGYEASGGISGAIAQSADRLYQSMDAEQRVLCRSVLLRLVALAPDGSPVRRRAPSKPLRGDAARDQVLAMLAGSRLVSTEADSVAVAHESLATAWPRLHTWLEEDAEGARTFAAISAAAETWNADGRPDDELHRGGRLQAVLDWRESARPDLTETESAFIDASAELATSELRDLTARQRRDATQNRRLRIALAVAGALFLTTASAGSIALVRSEESARNAENARIEAITSTSLALRSSDPDVAAILAAEAYRRWPDDARARSALWGTMTSAGGRMGATAIPDADLSASAVVPGTREALVVRDQSAADGEGEWTTDLVLVDIDSGEVIRTITDSGLPPFETQLGRDVHVSADGRVAIVQSGVLRDDDDPDSCCANRLDFFDLETGTALGGSQLVDSRTSSEIDLGEDGSVAYIANPVTGDVMAVDSATGAVRSSGSVDPDETQGVDGVTDSVTIIDDRRVAVGGPDAITVYLRDTLEVVERLEVPAETSENDLSPDGRGGLVSAGFGGITRYDLDSGTISWHRPPERTYGYAELAVSVERDAVYASDWEGNVDEFSLETGEPTGRTFSGERGGVAMAVVVDDGGELVIVDRSLPVFLHWRLDSAGPASRLVARGHVATDGFSGHEYAVVMPRPTAENGPGEQVLWDLARDVPLEERGTWLGWLADGILGRWTEGDGLSIVEVSTGRAYPVQLDPVVDLTQDDTGLASGGSGPLAFAFGPDWISPIDPATGAAAGPTIRLPRAAAGQGIASISETRSTEELVVTWWSNTEGAEMTSVFDLTTGDELRRGLLGDGISLATPLDEVVSAADERLVRSPIDSLEPTSTLPKPSSLGRTMQVSDDGSTLLVASWDETVSLYDLAGGIRLAEPIVADAPELHPGFLRSDGRSMLTNSAHGVLLWDLDAAHHAQAACRLAGRDLTPAEWATYLGDLGPYQETCAQVLGGQGGRVDVEG